MNKTRLLILSLVLISIVVAGCSSGTNVPELGDKEIARDKILVFKSPSCGCCGGYVSDLKSKGLNVEVTETENLIKVKQKYNIPPELQSCHTSFVGGYFVEGHVPLEAVNKMLQEKPDIDGIALPGMPSGSAGMPGAKKEPFKIYSIKDGVKEEFMII